MLCRLIPIDTLTANLSNVVAALTAGTNVQIAANGTISATDTNTTYSAGTGLSLDGTTFNNTAPDQTVTITGSGLTETSTVS